MRTIKEQATCLARAQSEEKPGGHVQNNGDPKDRVSGDEPMTGAQASCLKILSEESGEPDAFSDDLTKAEASRRINELKARVNR